MLAVLVSFAATATSEQDGPVFQDIASEVGLDFKYNNGMSGHYRMPEIVGGGAGWLDYDNDGDLDLFAVQGGSVTGKSDAAGESGAEVKTAATPPGDRLFRNEMVETGRLRFSPLGAETGLVEHGYGMGVATGDYDNDGLTDIYVTNLGSNVLWRNLGEGRFEDVTARAGVDDARWSVSAAFFDFDRDGFLDLFVANYVDYTPAVEKQCRAANGVRDYCGPYSYQPARDRLWRNRGDGTFEDITAGSGLDAPGSSLGVAVEDFNDDGRLDLYVANDGMANHMWLNQGSGRFRNEALLSGTALNRLGRPEASMGVVAADFDGDTRVDLFLTHLAGETNTLYLNQGSGFFLDDTAARGLAKASTSLTGFGTVALDYDNDGWLDIAAANGAVHVPSGAASDEVFPFAQRNQLFHNLGAGRFAEVSRKNAGSLGLEGVSRGLASADVDNDGDVDLLVINNNGPARLLLNLVGADHTWVGVVLSGSGGATTGAQIRLADGDRVLTHRVGTAGSYASANDPRAVFGLGARAASPDLKVTVTWPDGFTEPYRVATGRYTTIVRKGIARKVIAKKGKAP